MASSALFFWALVGGAILGMGRLEATSTLLSPEGKVKIEFRKVALDNSWPAFRTNVTISKYDLKNRDNSRVHYINQCVCIMRQ